jgi:hypothetical protein
MSITSILGYGAIGLGFLLAYLAYRLLLQEQGTKTPRPEILKAIYLFECFCVVLVVLGSILQYSANEDKAKAELLSEKNRALDNDLKFTKDNLAAAQLLAKAADVCETKLQDVASIVAAQRKAIENSTTMIDGVLTALVTQNKLAINDSCPDGEHGGPSSHGGEITGLNTSISSDVAKIKGILSSAPK